MIALTKAFRSMPTLLSTVMLVEIPNIMGLTIVQGVGKGSVMVVRAKRVYVATRTRYQEVVIADLEDFGLSLVLDGYIQSAEIDEYIYHESLVHPAMVLHPSPRKVLIVGGGEGATLREVLKHRTVEEATMVDIDGELVELCKKYLEPMHRGAFSDPRARIVIEDGKKFVEETKDRYDVIILDLTDPYSSEIAKELYTEPFYRKVLEHLNPGGVIVTQAGNSFFYEEVYDGVLQSVSKVFRYVLEYNVWIPSFGYACNFILASNDHDPTKLRPEDVDARLRERGVETKFFCGATYLSMLSTPIYRRGRCVRRSL